MKKLLIISATVLLSTVASAQTVRSYKSTSSQANGLTYTLPQTSLKVNVVCQRESVRKGPYARFAQKYFGTMAPLADKDVYTITSASFEAFEEADPSQVYVLENAEKSPVKLYDSSVEGMIIAGVGGQGKASGRFDAKALSPNKAQRCDAPIDTSFMSVPLSKLSYTLGSIEEQAAEAAEALITLRRRRFDLITGEMGENVFGAGLGDAIKEMEKMEKEYIALFFGKTFTTTEVKSYDVVPDGAQKAIVVCRFSESAGLVASSDLAGSPIVLEMTPENKAKSSIVPASSSKDSKVFMRVADVVACSLKDGNKTIAEQRVPIFQFGKVIEVPVSSLK